MTSQSLSIIDLKAICEFICKEHDVRYEYYVGKLLQMRALIQTQDDAVSVLEHLVAHAFIHDFEAMYVGAELQHAVL